MPALPPPKKSLGQHFLTDPAICRRIVSLLDPSPRDNIMEIGPGRGALTKILAAAPHALLLLLEKDAALAKNFGQCKNAQAINCDAMTFDWSRLANAGQWKIIGNLPYNVASPLIWNILSKTTRLKKAVFMVQKEVAMRLTASPGSKSYGALTVWTQNFASSVLQFQLAPGAFSPPPKVHSAVVSFDLLPNPPQNPAILRNLINICFQKRRKQLGVIFRRSNLPLFEKALEALRINPSCRPENITPMQFREISEFSPDNQK